MDIENELYDLLIDAICEKYNDGIINEQDSILLLEGVTNVLRAGVLENIDTLAEDNNDYKREYKKAMAEYKENMRCIKKLVREKDFKNARLHLKKAQDSLKKAKGIITDMDSSMTATALSWITPSLEEAMKICLTEFTAVIMYEVSARMVGSAATKKEHDENVKVARAVGKTLSHSILFIRKLRVTLKNPSDNATTNLNATRARILLEFEKLEDKLEDYEDVIDDKEDKYNTTKVE
jgi:Zn-dependent oligopeptidase